LFNDTFYIVYVPFLLTSWPDCAICKILGKLGHFFYSLCYRCLSARAFISSGTGYLLLFWYHCLYNWLDKIANVRACC